MSLKDWVYYIGAGWFGVILSVVGFDYLTWQFYLILLSYVVLGWELAFGRKS